VLSGRVPNDIYPAALSSSSVAAARTCTSKELLLLWRGSSMLGSSSKLPRALGDVLAFGCKFMEAATLDEDESAVEEH